METLLVETWHHNARGIGEEELERWKHVPFLLILICTGAAVPHSRIEQWMSQNRGRCRPKDFFCVLDQSNTQEIWGPDFEAIARSVKARV